MPEHPLLNFFDQLKIDNTYELFFPKKEQGLVIIWLYEKIKNKTFPNGIFKEAAIQQAFQEISLLSREKIERNPWDHYNRPTSSGIMRNTSAKRYIPFSPTGLIRQSSRSLVWIWPPN